MNPFVADPGWGWWIILYFFLGGLAAGSYFLATLIELCGPEEDRPLARIGYRVALPLIMVCGILLIVDLERPERFWHMVLQSEVVEQAIEEGWPLGGWGTMTHALMLKWWSPMSIGAQALGIFGLCSFLSFLGSLWPQGRLAHLLGSHWLGRGFKLLGCAVGFFIASYTGALLTATNQPLWSDSDWIAPLFLTSSASTGVALLLLLGRRIPEASLQRLERADLWVMGLEFFIFLLFLASVGGVLPWALATWEGLLLVLGTLVIGLLLPMCLHLGLRAPSASRVNVAALCALVGGFLLRFGMVRSAPAILHKFPNLSPGDVDAPLWHGWVGLGLLGLTLVLGLLIPYVLTRQWRLAPGQTALAGLVSVLVIAGVGIYAFNPPQLQSDLLPGISLSPEFQRPRGGGPGASDMNRPAQPITKSKFIEARGAMTSIHPKLRPRDFALLLLASRDLRPRQRARDQRADVAGLDLKRRILQQLADEDPEPAETEAVLFRAIEHYGPPFGPTRALATLIHEEWHAACISPDWVMQLLAEAVDLPKAGGERPTDG